MGYDVTPVYLHLTQREKLLKFYKRNSRKVMSNFLYNAIINYLMKFHRIGSSSQRGKASETDEVSNHHSEEIAVI